MGLKKNTLTLQEFASHIAAEVMQADIDFQSRQQMAWKELGKIKNALAGYTKQEALALDEIDCSLNLSPVPPSWLHQLKLFLNIQTKPSVAYYKLAKAGALKTAITIKIVLKREKAGKFRPGAISSSETTLKPEEIHVLDFIK